MVLCKRVKRLAHKGLVDFIGITGHKPRVLVKAIETGEFDTVLVPLNVGNSAGVRRTIANSKRT